MWILSGFEAAESTLFFFLIFDNEFLKSENAGSYGNMLSWNSIS